MSDQVYVADQPDRKSRRETREEVDRVASSSKPKLSVINMGKIQLHSSFLCSWPTKSNADGFSADQPGIKSQQQSSGEITGVRRQSARLKEKKQKLGKSAPTVSYSQLTTSPLDAQKPPRPCTTFKLFRKLPLELRLVIWDLTSYREPQFIPLLWNPNTKTGTSKYSTPIVLHVNQESRAEGLRTYKSITIASTHTRTSMHVEVYINPNIDTAVSDNQDPTIPLLSVCICSLHSYSQHLPQKYPTICDSDSPII